MPIINIPGCPPNPEWLCAVLIAVPCSLASCPSSTPRTSPRSIFGQTIHDNCQRRGHFENGEFVYQFGSPTKRLRATACTRWAAVVRRPRPTAALFAITTVVLGALQAGAPCIGCCEANPNDPGQNWIEVNTPFCKRHRDLNIGDFKFQPGHHCLLPSSASKLSPWSSMASA